MILLIGGRGSIGRRYQAVLRHLNQPFRILDLGDEIDLKGIERAIIASPTEKHRDHALLCHDAGIPFLCEKPLSKDLTEAEEMAALDGYVVNNYQFALPAAPLDSLYYDFFHTGRDGLVWDVCQLVYIAANSGADLFVTRNQPIWYLFVNWVRVPYAEIEKSYVDMIRAFLNNQVDKLWTLKDGLDMAKICADLSGRAKEGYEAINWNPIANTIETFTREDISNHRAKKLTLLGL